MIKYIMRKTIYKNFDSEAQEMFLKLISKQHIVEFFCSQFWLIMYLFAFLPLIIIDLFEDIQLTITTQIIILVFILMYFTLLLLMFKFCRSAVTTFEKLLSNQLYFLIYTSKGKALSHEDFQMIKNYSDDLYNFISSQICRGYCYSICFDILKILKKGHIEFIATKKFDTHSKENDDDTNFELHVLYVNNGWAFDTYCQRQFPVEELHNIYKAKIFKTFCFEEINKFSSDTFLTTLESELLFWCIRNNCSSFRTERTI